MLKNNKLLIKNKRIESRDQTEYENSVNQSEFYQAKETQDVLKFYLLIILFTKIIILLKKLETSKTNNRQRKSSEYYVVNEEEEVCF